MVSVTPLGRAPVSLNVVEVGYPEAITVKEPFVPTVKVVVLALLMAGAWSTVNVKLCEGVLEPFVAEMVIA